MKIDIPKFLLFVMMTTAAAVAANSSKLAIEGEKSLSNNEEQTTTTTTTTPEGFAASSLLSLSSPLSLVDANAVIVDRTSEHSDPPPSFAMVATAKKTTKHAKKNKTSDGTNDGTSDGFAPATERPIKPLGLDLTCDPSQQKNLDMANGCQDNDCAHPVWADGCEGCMCFNYNNPTWCDGYRGDFYDTYFKDHGDNPFGDPNWRNRKCNPIFRPHSKYCSAHWQCEKGLYCQDSTSPGGGERGLCDICNDLISTVNCDEL